MTPENYYEALKFATKHHDNVFDDDRLPSILHPARVAEQFAIIGRYDLATAAVLHDTVEDTIATVYMIKCAFGENIANLVDLLTRPIGEVYVDYIKRVSTSADATAIKLADIRDNLYRRGPVVSGMQTRYLKAIATLIGAHNV